MDEILSKGKKPTPLPIPIPVPTKEEKLMELFKQKREIEKKLQDCRICSNVLQEKMKSLEAQIQKLWGEINGNNG
jgi:chaperonin cofactor prefoldin